MNPIVQFNSVSKKYNLGMTRVSLPSLVSEYAKLLLRGSKPGASNPSSYWALKDVSFSLNRGESLALIGANGAGKTTTLKLLANITRPTSGHISVNGKLSALIELGAGFHPDLTGRENIFLNGAILGLKRPEIERRFDSIVAFAELEKFIDTPLKRYSSGMAVRLGFAVAASIEPDILLVDEVLAVGDVSFRLKSMSRMQELLDNGTTLVFVSHNMGLVKAVCKLGMFIENGVVKCFGTSGEAIEAYNQSLNEQRAHQFQGIDETMRVASPLANILKVEVKGPGPDGDNSLLTNRPAKVNVFYKAYEDLGDISADLHFFRSDGVGCIKIFSRIDQAKLHVTKGDGLISVMLDPIQLVPGKYSVVATLKNLAESYTYDYVFSDWFQVDDELAGKGADDLESVFMPNSSWYHEPNLLAETELDQKHTERKSL